MKISNVRDSVAQSNIKKYCLSQPGLVGMHTFIYSAVVILSSASADPFRVSATFSGGGLILHATMDVPRLYLGSIPT